MTTPLPLPRNYADAKNDLLHGIWDRLSLLNGKSASSLEKRTSRANQGTSTEDLLFQIASELDQLYIPVSVKGFGAVGDGVHDDTQAFRDALKSNRTVLIPPTDAYYKVSDLSTIANVSHLTIQAKGAKILNSDLTKASWLFQLCTDLTIDGGDFGYVITPTANGGNSQHVLQIDQSQRVVINGIHVLNSPEMGVAITMSNQVTVQHSLIEHTWRDGTYSHYSANVNYVNNTYQHCKDDAMSFHDYGRASERTFIAALGYNQAANIKVDRCTVENCYQGFSSVAGSGISVTNCTFKNIVGAGVALMNQKLLWPDGTAKLNDASIERNTFYKCCSETTINGTAYPNYGQGSSGRASICVVSLGDNNELSLTELKRLSNVRIRNNSVLESGALGLHCSSTDGLTVSGNTFQNCTVSGNTLGGSAVEIWECTGYVEESINTVIDNRNPIQHQRGYSYSGAQGTKNNWVVVGRLLQDGIISNSPSLLDVSIGTIKSGSATQNANGSATAFAFPHFVGKQPGYITAQSNRDNSNIDGITCDATSIVVTYKTAPSAGPITWYWQAIP